MIVSGRETLFQRVRRNRELYLFMLPAFVLTVVFAYVPMYGVLMAFQDTRIGQSFGDGRWVGLANFLRLFRSSMFWTILRNTLSINLVGLFCGIPLPIILALFLHHAPFRWLKKTAQTASYLPYLLSAVVVVSIINLFCNGEFGLINILLHKLGMAKISFFGKPEWVLPIYVISALWQSTGYSAVIYLAALSAIDPELTEAAMIDGASKLQRMIHIDLKIIQPTIITLLILSVGSLLMMGTDKILLLQTDLNLEASETITTYVYKTGIIGGQYGFATAVGLFNNIGNLILLLSVNAISRKLTQQSLF